MKTVKIGDKEIKIRRAKVKEVKNLIKDTATKITEVADFFFNRQMTDEELINSLMEAIMENIEFFEDYVLQFTVDFTQDNFDDLEFLDAILLIKEIVAYNGIKGKFVKNFFHNLNQVMTTQAQPQEKFIKEVPKV
ncbi:hypothetical protein [Tepidimicrobium xylanilyticum]|uniref:Uncharacterized protein n=1 Tax=Tepidimicrobium xylanilyticum TaxID=1123352 RepID=A0A1H3EJK5_9FIRM|nr:hypothetical protein [Tepidimicrobium xylanilyticum]GMG96257.1 hypothetical protein EN5CB1_10830 [Tepidimicrobium xylanilyticum]SDX78952.1 hypothetical protein SAMN05660923_02938 [Tepidimicrobium xylanilyticum]